jgi:hypothetical protein
MLLGEDISEQVQATLPSPAPFADPSLGCPQHRRSEPAGSDAPHLLGVDQSAVQENLNVLNYCSQRHVQRNSELAH